MNPIEQKNAWLCSNFLNDVNSKNGEVLGMISVTNQQQIIFQAGDNIIPEQMIDILRMLANQMEQQIQSPLILPNSNLSIAKG